MILNTMFNSLRSNVSQWGILCCCLLICTLCVTSGVLAQTSFGSAGKAQTGDLGNFKNGFEIDGNLPANNFINPDSVGSDWTPTPIGFSGLGEAHINCSKVVQSTADGGIMIYSQDGVAGIDNDSSVFAQSNKVNDDPNTYNYKEGTVSQKTDIQNIQIHLSPDASGDLWFVGSGDRKATNGDSFIGVEFLQAGLVKTPLNNQGVGGFFTTGPDGGRTVGDLRLDTRFLNGGSNPTIFISKWQPIGGGVFKWIDLPVDSVDTTKIFIAGNSDSADVCYGAFGSTKYKPNAFLEFAVNFSSLVGGNDPCKKFNSIFVYTRSSHSETASMEDFGGLFGFDFCTDVEPPTVTFCPTNQTIQCTATPVFGTPTFTDNCEIDHIDSNTVTTPGNCPQEYSVTRTWTAFDNCGNTAQCSQTIDVVDDTPPVITCPSNQTFECNSIGAFNNATATDNCDQSVTPTEVRDTSGTCPIVIRRIWTATDDCGNSSKCTSFVNIDDTTPPQITCPATQNFECNSIGAFNSATATDNCDPSVTPTEVRDTSGTCPVVIRRIWTSTDDCGNVSKCTSFVNIDDTTPPQITCPATQNFECNEIGAFNSATATDNCDQSVTPTEVRDTSGTCPIVIRRIWTSTDDCGNVSKCTSFVNIDDTTPPQITCPATQNFECNEIGAFNNATATDNCDQSVTPTEVRDTSGTCPIVIRRIWTSTDDCGNVSKCTSFVNIDDTTPPQITCPATQNFECNEIGAFNSATATDNCDQSVTPTEVRDTSGTCPVVIRRIWTSTDDCGNVSKCTSFVNIDDTTPPQITCPATQNFECDNVGAFASASATDNCDTDVSISERRDTLGGQCPFVIRRIFTATDDCGNTAVCTSFVNINDTQAPQIGCPVDQNFECNSIGTFANASATDNCDGNVTIGEVRDTSGSCPIQIRRIWTATDDCGNASKCTSFVYIDDTTPPVLTCPANQNFECSAVGAFNNASATDNCDQSVTPTEVRDTTVGSCPQNLDIRRIWTSTDDCGNVSKCTSFVFIRDTQAPQITCPADQNFECDAVGAFNNATATDNCDPSVTPTEVRDTSGSCPIQIRRIWTSTDDCGNSSKCTSFVYIDDTTPPQLTCPANQNFECSAVGAFNNASATDNCDQSVTPTEVRDTTVGSCPQNLDIRRIWTSTDDCGNVSKCTSFVFIRDTQAPQITCPADQNFECDAVGAFNNATASDNCDPSVTPTEVRDTSGSCPIQIRRIWTATDDCGNSSKCTSFVYIDDTTPPQLTCPANQNFECSAVGAFNSATATDNCDQSVTPTEVRDTTVGSCPQNLDIRRIWTSTDDCGNVSKCTSFVFIRDTQAPQITCPADQNFECNAVGAFNNATASDNCDPSVTPTEVRDTSGSCPIQIRRIWTSTDDCGNSSKCTSFVYIDDTTLPQIVCAANATIPCSAAVEFTPPTATDNCDLSPAISIQSNDTTAGPDGSTIYTRTWIATDDCGNASASCSQSITRLACPGGHIFPTQTSCDMYRTGTATRLVNICYDKSSGKVSNAVPGVFFYWGKFTATATKETVKVIQTNSVGDPNWLYRIHQGNQIYIYDDSCKNLVQGSESPTRGQGRVILSNAVIGRTYFLSVKYNVKSIIGATITTPIVINRFSVLVNGVLDAESVDSVRAKEKGADCSEFGPQSQRFGEGIRESSPNSIPTEFAMHANYPNPFNPTTVIKYDLPEASTVRLSVFNVLGQEVATLANSVVDAGYQSVLWNTENSNGVSLPSGIYMYRLQATSLTSGNEFVKVSKMVLLK